MTVLDKIKKSKYHLLFSVIPIITVVGTIKIACHFLGLEVIPKDLTAFFPSILTGIIFILGFLLAGVVTDFKESEKIPNEIASSLYSLWQEADYIRRNKSSSAAKNLMEKIRNFIPTFKHDFFTLKNDKLQKLLDSFTDDFIEMEKYITRLKADQANIKKIINRIIVIKKTDFVPSVFVCIEAITFVFLAVYCLLKVEPWWAGLILVCIFTFVIFAILFLIKDMEDPFEYDGADEAKSDEVSLEVLDILHKDFMEKEI
jgi:ABC-type multidrug transport system fused ATPase/permease subunit